MKRRWLVIERVELRDERLDVWQTVRTALNDFVSGPQRLSLHP
jgi:hypothetical protein